jgi:actin-related protein
VRGEIEEWEQMEKILQYTFFNCLRVDPYEGNPILLIDNSLTSGLNHEKLTTLMFETFNAKKLLIRDASSMPLFASGRTSGLVVNCGDEITLSTAFFEGYRVPESFKKTARGGRDITKFMTNLLKSIEMPLTSSSEF